MKPNYKKVSHYNTGQPWDKKKEPKPNKEPKQESVTIDPDSVTLTTYQSDILKQYQYYFMLGGDHHYGKSWSKEPKTVATIYTAKTVSSEHQTNDKKEVVNGVEYAVLEHEVKATGKPKFYFNGDFFDHDWLRRHFKPPTLKGRIQAFLNSEEIADGVVKDEHSLLILPKHIQTEREKEEKVQRFETFVKERIEASTAPFEAEVKKYKEANNIQHGRIEYQKYIIAGQRAQIEDLTARLAVFEEAKAQAEARAYKGHNHRVFEED